MRGTPREDLIERLKDLQYRKLYGTEQAKLEIAALLYKARKKSNLTQKEVSEKLNISQPYIAKLEAGEANPTIGLIGGILSIMGFRIIAGIESIIPKSSSDSFDTSTLPKPKIINTVMSMELNQGGLTFEPYASATEANWFLCPSSGEEEPSRELVAAGGF